MICVASSNSSRELWGRPGRSSLARTSPQTLSIISTAGLARSPLEEDGRQPPPVPPAGVGLVLPDRGECR